MKMFNIPNLFTAGNMLCGVFAIILAFAGFLQYAPIFIFIGAILDFFDGFLARLLKQQGELGKQLDSLADMITFGLAPGVIMFNLLVITSQPTGEFHFWIDYNVAVQWNSSTIPLGTFAALIIPFFSMFRLAKFNIDTRQSESFIGLPTPANTIFFMAFPLLLAQYGNQTGWEHDLIIWLIQPMVLIPIIVIMSLLLVSELPLFALKFKSFGWNGNEIRYIFLISCGILIPTLLFWSIPIIVLLYLILSFIHNILRKNRTHEI